MGEPASREAPALRGPRLFLEALLGSGLFTGYFPLAPATVTSLSALFPSYLLAPHPLWHALAVAGLFFGGVKIAGDLETVWGRDPRRVTIDEVVGTLITFFLLPLSVWGMLVGFAFFRVFDIAKLPFIDKSQRLPGGWGVMIDDVLAGACAQVATRLVLWGATFVPAVHNLLTR